MAYEPKDNSGSLFKNDRKEQPNHPDYKGSIMVNGVEYWLSAWIKTTKDDLRWLSIAVQKKDTRPKARPPRQERGGFDDMQDDAPF